MRSTAAGRCLVEGTPALPFPVSGARLGVPGPVFGSVSWSSVLFGWEVGLASPETPLKRVEFEEPV